mmetsp:Transcript_23697/g.74549  ORF Transcript_23697/g.74549 Transcript_23697/m.74549 type:complete len:225 (+) Transcript_23697:1077-1751(+)
MIAGMVCPLSLLASTRGCASSHNWIPQPSLRCKRLPLTTPLACSRSMIAASLVRVNLFSSTLGEALPHTRMATCRLSSNVQCFTHPTAWSRKATAALLLPEKVLDTNAASAEPEMLTPEPQREDRLQPAMQARPWSTETHEASLMIWKPRSCAGSVACVARPQTRNLAGTVSPEPVRTQCCKPSLPRSVTGLVRTSSSAYTPAATMIVVGGQSGAWSKASPMLW